MKVESIAIGPNQGQIDASSKILSPELLAAVGARYSRSNQGLDEIYDMVDKGDTEKSIDNIFKFVSYGHASISDMAPVSMFLDDISLWAAYTIFAQCPTGSGQESSTRYIDFGKRGLDVLIDQEYLPRPKEEYKHLFESFDKSCEFWEKHLDRHPECLDLSGKTEAAKKSLRQNYIFDRTRYLLPLACKTNMMLLQSARSWVKLATYLYSSDLLEFNDLAQKIMDQLSIVSPRMVKHAKVSDCSKKLQFPFNKTEQNDLWNFNLNHKNKGSFLEGGCLNDSMTNQDIYLLNLRETRYDEFPGKVNMTPVKFGWNNIAFAEIRDLNRHRTGEKILDAFPAGYYFASDQVKSNHEEYTGLHSEAVVSHFNTKLNYHRNSSNYIYDCLLGTEFRFEHLTTLNQFLYEAELRTGAGAHFRYKELMNDVLDLFLKENGDFKGRLFDNQESFTVRKNSV